MRKDFRVRYEGGLRTRIVTNVHRGNYKVHLYYVQYWRDGFLGFYRGWKCLFWTGAGDSKWPEGFYTKDEAIEAEEIHNRHIDTSTQTVWEGE